MKYTEEMALSTDPEILTDILIRVENDWVSWCTIKNPNCPPEIKIKWMKKYGLIVKEDSSKHIIEYEKIKIKEDDFQDLKDLL